MHDVVRLLLVLAALGAGGWSAVRAHRLQHAAVTVEAVVESVDGRGSRVRYTDSAGRERTGLVPGAAGSGEKIEVRYADVWRQHAMVRTGGRWPYAEPVCIVLATAAALVLTYLI